MVSRLCEPVSGLDGQQLAEWLGMDASLYSRRRVGGGEGEGEGEDILLGGVAEIEGEPLKAACGKCKLVTEISTSVSVTNLIV